MIHIFVFNFIHGIPNGEDIRDAEADFEHSSSSLDLDQAFSFDES
jgi:hypothetical protein